MKILSKQNQLIHNLKIKEGLKKLIVDLDNMRLGKPLLVKEMDTLKNFLFANTWSFLFNG